MSRRRLPRWLCRHPSLARIRINGPSGASCWLLGAYLAGLGLFGGPWSEVLLRGGPLQLSRRPRRWPAGGGRSRMVAAAPASCTCRSRMRDVMTGSASAANWTAFRFRPGDWLGDPAMSPINASFARKVLGPSASSSASDARSTGALESASASTLILPGTHFAVKMKRVIWRRRRSSRGLSSLSSEYSLRIGISGRWSVMRSNAGSPSRNGLHFFMAHAAARHFSSFIGSWTRPKKGTGIRLGLVATCWSLGLVALG